MNYPKWINWLKNKWNIQSDRDFWMIMLTFSLSGIFIMLTRKIIFQFFGITEDTSLWIKLLLYIPLIPPSYYAGLLFFGAILGQFRFFWEYEKKTIRFLLRLKDVKH